ncbi:MAG: ABC transporter permease [Chloroflexota bacterium]|nr:ABC transporter permease [Chloroflexota bacterium]
MSMNVPSPNQESISTRTARLDLAVFAAEQHHESYMQLVWRRFRRSKVAIIGALMVIMLIVLAIFSDFFSPTDPGKLVMVDSYIPPQRVHFFDEQGKFHLRPFTYLQQLELAPETFEPIWSEDTSQKYFLRFLVESWQYKILGIIPSRLHLYDVEEGGTIFLLGTDKFGRDLFGRSCEAGRISLSLSLFATFITVALGSFIGVYSGYHGGTIDNLLQRFIEFMQSFPQLALWMALAAIIPPTWGPLQVFMVMAMIFALLGWTQLARQVRGQIMAFRETDFIMAAKEMGASDNRIIFKHLFPNSLSHVIVVLTLTVPSIILAEAFLSFLGIGIQEPLVSWGFLMKEANSLQTLGSHTWILSPVIFIIVAVLGFNFLGDGLRDAADPYSTAR